MSTLTEQTLTFSVEQFDPFYRDDRAWRTSADFATLGLQPGERPFRFKIVGDPENYSEEVLEMEYSHELLDGTLVYETTDYAERHNRGDDTVIITLRK